MRNRAAVFDEIPQLRESYYDAIHMQHIASGVKNGQEICVATPAYRGCHFKSFPPYHRIYKDTRTSQSSGRSRWAEVIVGTGTGIFAFPD
jgi:hypothetical protein